MEYTLRRALRIKERARMLGGNFEIWSEEGKGTRITFRIPKSESRGDER